MKIAFMFMIYDSLEYEKVWSSFFKHAKSSQFSIYIHSKNGKTKLKDKLFIDAIIPSVPTKWGDLLYAEMQLFKYAYRKKSNHIFVLVSNSTIPLKSFDYVYNSLSQRSVSYVQQGKLPSFEWHNTNLPAVGVGRSSFRKGSQWVTLIRPHVKLIIDNTKLIEKWGMRNEDVIGDEVYIPTLLTYFKKETEMSDKTDTWVDWDTHKYAYNPETYKSVTLKMITSLLASKYLFARKFVKSAQVINGTRCTSHDVRNKKVVDLSKMLMYVVTKLCY